jgi:glycosyltransferase involved in cell wall biosynthesis
MTYQLTISVVIPTYNRARTVGKAIESVLSQTRPADEIIVVDDGSSDDTVQALQAYGDLIRVVSRPNTGISGARNDGIKVATSDWVAFLDDDDEYAPERLQIAAESIILHPQALVHASNMRILSENSPPVSLFKIRGKNAGELMLLDQPLIWTLAGCFFVQATVCNRSALIAENGFRNDFYEDLDLLVRLTRGRSWSVDNRCSVSLIRRPDEDFNLSSYWRSKPIENYQALTRIHREALEFPDLTAEERSVVKSSLATNLFELGRSLTAHGDRLRAREAFREAGRLYPKCHSRVKARLAASLGSPALKLMSLFQRQRGVFRSSAVKS